MIIKRKNRYTKNLILLFLLFVLIDILAISIFKNISYPLFWNDEGETIIHASSILKFGYPKVHVGKNVLNLTEQSDKSIGVKENIDAWIHIGWAQYYFAAPWVYLAQQVDDLYQKNLIIRTPFALAGFLGIFFFAASILRVFRTRSTIKIIFLLSFFFLETLSVFLPLQLRSVRQHSLILLLSAIAIFIYIEYRFFDIHKYLYYFILPIILAIIFNTYFPVYFVFLTALSFYECIHLYDWIKSKHVRANKLLVIEIGRRFFPLAASLLAVIPMVFFYEIFYISQKFSEFRNFSFNKYLLNLLKIFNFYLKYEFLGLVLIIKSLTILVWRKKLKAFNATLVNGSIFKVSTFLSLFTVIYVLIIARTPDFMERYYLSLQPIFVLILLLDLFFLIQHFKNNIKVKMSLGYLLIIGLGITIMGRVGDLRGHLFELFNRYKGPLDFAIPYIKENFSNTEDLVIATNYEEQVFMYYLGSRVTVGYVGNNLEEDLKIQPDIIIMRRGYIRNAQVLHNLLEKERYEKITLPVFDYYFNNIPELTYPASHLFQTPIAKYPEERMTLYVRKKS